MLEVKNLSVTEKKGKPILEAISLTIHKGNCIGLTGPSGSGKTTLIKSIMGMSSDGLTITGGDILLDGVSLISKSPEERRLLCGKVLGFIPQNPMTSFFSNMKIGKQITETFRLHMKLDKQGAHSLAVDVLKSVNLMETDRILEAYPSQLSGGMLQRISMAILLGSKPKYILADEPTSALDEINRDLLLEQLTHYKDAGILFISHDAAAMKSLCSTTHVMERSKIIETQTTLALFHSPQTEWSKRFAAAANKEKESNWKWTELK
jgi:ABC-type glutathione transport system ATPase component